MWLRSARAILVVFVSCHLSRGDAWVSTHQNARQAASHRGVAPLLWGWSRQACFATDPSNASNANIEMHIQVSDCTKDSVNRGQATSYNLASPREWLESFPDGAYTVIRCDFINGDGTAPGRWKVWGRDFHLDRLRQSFQTWAKQTNCQTDPFDWTSLREETCKILEFMLSHAEKEDIASQKTGYEAANKSFLESFMVTLLWFKDPHSTAVNVRGHILSIPGSNDSPELDPAPMKAAVAFTNDAILQLQLPSRMPDPQAKLTSWCSQRRPLERQFKLPVDGIGEVLLVSPPSVSDNCSQKSQSLSHGQLLEGLTSNLFVLYPEGVLRTTEHGVLLGYARQLVLESVERLGFKVDLSTPIHLSESDAWQEVFVTSAVKIIAPVGKILIPTEGNQDKHTHLEELWSEKASSFPCEGDSKVWQSIYRDIIATHLR
jgi:hypothetical protein